MEKCGLTANRLSYGTNLTDSAGPVD